MFERIRKIFSGTPAQHSDAIHQEIEPITGLHRASANVKIMWTPTTTTGMKSQHITVSAGDRIFIDKDIAVDDYAFSFAANKGAHLTISIRPYNGAKFGPPTEIDVIV